jgi:hypothetical protein
LYVWQGKDLRADFSYVWQGKELADLSSYSRRTIPYRLTVVKDHFGTDRVTVLCRIPVAEGLQFSH